MDKSIILALENVDKLVESLNKLMTEPGVMEFFVKENLREFMEEYG